MASAVVIFDGVCTLCTRSVRFILDRDPEGVFQFASAQSDRGRALLAAHGLADVARTGVVLLERDASAPTGTRVSTHSTAALRIVARLRRPWPLLAVLRVVPAPPRDAVYGLIAANRYRWFGHRDEDVCLVPTPALRARLLD